MAKIQGLTGGLSGKMGNAVFRQSRGQTIVSQYQPHVTNPKSEAQSEARAKFKLMSQLAAIMQPALGTLSVNERPARGRETPRNRFVQLNYPLATATTDGMGNIVADIDMVSLQLTSSFRPLNASLDRLSLDEGVIAGDVAVTNSAITMLRLVVVGYTEPDGEVPAQAFVEREIVVTRTGAEAFAVNVTGVQSKKVTVLAYGLIPSEGMTAENLDNIETIDPFTSQVALNRLVAAGAAVETQTIGTNLE